MGHTACEWLTPACAVPPQLLSWGLGAAEGGGKGMPSVRGVEGGRGPVSAWGLCRLACTGMVAPAPGAPAWLGGMTCGRVAAFRVGRVAGQL